MKHKMFRKILLMLLLSVLFVTAAAAEDAVDVDAFSTFDSALGGYYGEIGGQGLSYQRWFGELGIQTAFGLWYVEPDVYLEEPSYSPSTYEHNLFSYNIGVEVMYRVYSDSFQDWFDGCLYVFGGIMHMGNLVTSYNYSQTAAGDDETNTYPFVGTTGPAYVALFNPGIGIGFELVLFNHFSIPFEIGLMGSWATSSLMPVDAGIRVQSGLRYRY